MPELDAATALCNYEAAAVGIIARFLQPDRLLSGILVAGEEVGGGASAELRCSRIGRQVESQDEDQNEERCGREIGGNDDPLLNGLATSENRSRYLDAFQGETPPALPLPESTNFGRRRVLVISQLVLELAENRRGNAGTDKWNRKFGRCCSTVAIETRRLRKQIHP